MFTERESPIIIPDRALRDALRPGALEEVTALSDKLKLTVHELPPRGAGLRLGIDRVPLCLKARRADGFSFSEYPRGTNSLL
jgi:hypothetical protein